MLRRMQVFFRSWAEIGAFVEQLHLLVCPRCGAQGSMGPHGWRRTYDSRGRRRTSGRRIRCLPRRGGCGKTPCLRPGNILSRRWIDAAELERFIRELVHGRSVKAAWERCGMRMSLDSGYRLYRRFWLCLPILRTRLCSRAPPPPCGQEKSALHQMFAHLGSALKADGMGVRTYQQAFQKDFLAVA